MFCWKKQVLCVIQSNLTSTWVYLIALAPFEGFLWYEMWLIGPFLKIILYSANLK